MVGKGATTFGYFYQFYAKIKPHITLICNNTYIKQRLHSFPKHTPHVPAYVRNLEFVNLIRIILLFYKIIWVCIFPENEISY